MNSFIPIFIILFIVLFIGVIPANPIMVFYIYELRPDSSDFALELYDLEGQTWDGWYITSNSDTAYFKSGLQNNIGFRLITQDSLLSPLSVNKKGDVITLYLPEEAIAMDKIRFGEVPQAEVAAPKPGQSICLNNYREVFQRYYYYLDNTPTLGAANDSSGIYFYQLKTGKNIITKKLLLIR